MLNGTLVMTKDCLLYTSGLRKAMMLDAIKVGRMHNIDYLRKGKTPPMMLHLIYKFYEKSLYALLKKTIGIDNGNFSPTAGAAVPEEICQSLFQFTCYEGPSSSQS